MCAAGKIQGIILVSLSIVIGEMSVDACFGNIRHVDSCRSPGLLNITIDIYL